MSANPAGNTVVLFWNNGNNTILYEGTNVVTKKALNNVVGVLAGKVNQMNNSVFFLSI
jgi:hypothetical protein